MLVCRVGFPERSPRLHLLDPSLEQQRKAIWEGWWMVCMLSQSLEASLGQQRKAVCGERWSASAPSGRACAKGTEIGCARSTLVGEVAADAR